MREWCIRARAAGVRGFYVPEMVVRHIIPAVASEQDVLPPLVLLARHQPRDALRAAPVSTWKRRSRRTLDFAKVPHVFGVPRYLYRKALAQRRGLAQRARCAATPSPSFDHELWVWFFAGIVQQRWRDSRTQSIPGAVHAK